ncbi:hypothetical protein VNO78_23569 [Psophocarpus tetragonolobus]|uniref:Uncharacterized protein n=1 Tax=Psophocarpus tetragonolobus TaxID=3891 RepID=A0AAN9S3W4_PSOTE
MESRYLGLTSRKEGSLKLEGSALGSNSNQTRVHLHSRSAMATPSDSDPSKQEAEAVVRRRNNGPPFKFLVPLIYAPVLPLIRLSLRHRPVLRDRLFTAVLAGAFLHGSYLVTDLYDIESK